MFAEPTAYSDTGDREITTKWACPKGCCPLVTNGQLEAPGHEIQMLSYNTVANEAEDANAGFEQATVGEPALNPTTHINRNEAETRRTEQQTNDKKHKERQSGNKQQVRSSADRDYRHQEAQLNTQGKGLSK